MKSEKVYKATPCPVLDFDLESVSTANPDNKENLRNDFNNEVDLEKYGTTKRGLKSRHVNLMVIGGAIGTGLFVGMGAPLTRAGPLSLFLGYLIFAIFAILPLTHAVAQISSWLPIKGSIFHLSSRIIDPAVGFAASWTYIYGGAMAICFESTVVVSIIEYWITSVNPGVWITIFLIFSISLNIFAVRYYGECEFVFSSFKVLLIIGLILLSFISMLGGNPKHDRYGFKNWTESGLFHEYLAEGNTGKFLGFWSTLLYAAFASGGPDILALVSGEVINPRVNIPKAAKASYFRVYLFYIVGIFFMITLCSSSNPLLVKAYEENATGAGLSPWVIGIKTVGISGLDSLVNAVILTSAWSCSNAYFFTSTRTLYSMSMAGYAPRFFQKCLKNGVPIYCQVFISLVACISYLSVSNSTVNVLNWFINLCSSAFLVNYALFFVIFIRFRQALSAQGIQETALYHRSFFASIPCALIGLTLLLLIIIFSGFKIFLKGHFSVSGLFTYYFSPVFFFVLVIFWKVYEKTEFKTAETADITSGKAEIDEEERKYLEDKLNGLDPDTKFEVFINKYLPFLRWVLL